MTGGPTVSGLLRRAALDIETAGNTMRSDEYADFPTQQFFCNICEQITATLRELALLAEVHEDNDTN